MGRSLIGVVDRSLRGVVGRSLRGVVDRSLKGVVDRSSRIVRGEELKTVRVEAYLLTMADPALTSVWAGQTSLEPSDQEVVVQLEGLCSLSVSGSCSEGGQYSRVVAVHNLYLHTECLSLLTVVGGVPTSLPPVVGVAPRTSLPSTTSIHTLKC